MGADAQRAEPVHEAHGGVDVARSMAAPAEVVAVEVEVVLEVELVDECRDLGSLSDGFDDRELDRGRVDVDLRSARRRLGCARVCARPLCGADFVWALESPALCRWPEGGGGRRPLSSYCFASFR